MKIAGGLIVGLLYLNSIAAQTSSSGKELIRTMHEKYYQAPCKTFTFSQHNTLYREDTISGRSIWHEAIDFPDKFKIEFGKKADSNYVVFKNDSVYKYEAGKLVRVGADSNSLLLLIGGMYYRNLDDVYARLKGAGYDMDVMCTHPWKGKTVFIIGAKENDFRKNQIWIDPATLKVLRIIERVNEKDMMDMCFEGHQKACNGYVENKVSFRRNGNLEQVENYFDIKEVSKFPD